MEIIDEVNPFEKLKETLVVLKEKTKGDALGYALEAQLAVLDSIFITNTSFISTTLLSSVDLLLQSLQYALVESSDAEQHELIRLKAAIMVNSIVFFSEVQLCYEEKKWRDEGFELLQRGCNLLADSAVGLMNAISVIPISKIDLAQSLVNAFLSKKGRSGFLSDVLWYLKNKDKSRQEFMAFIHSLIKKIYTYSYLFGNSLLLAELVERYKNKLIKIDCEALPPPPKMPKEIAYPVLEKTSDPILHVFCIGITMFLFIVSCVIIYNYGFNIVAIVFCILSAIGLVASTSIIGKDISLIKSNKRKIKDYNLEMENRMNIYNSKLDEYNNSIRNIEQYYDDIIQKFR